MRASSNKKTNSAKKDGEADVDHEGDSDDDFRFVSVGKDTRGLARAHRGYLEEARIMFRSDDALVEFLLNREPDAQTLRLEIWMSIVISIRNEVVNPFQICN